MGKVESSSSWSSWERSAFFSVKSTETSTGKGRSRKDLVAFAGGMATSPHHFSAVAGSEGGSCTERQPKEGSKRSEQFRALLVEVTTGADAFTVSSDGLAWSSGSERRFMMEFLVCL